MTTAQAPIEFLSIDVDALRHAIYVVSQRHDWANTTDTVDRTEEICQEYVQYLVGHAKEQLA